MRVVAPATPFLMVPMTVRLAGAGAAVLVDACDAVVAGLFLTTVAVLPSLDSLMPLTLLPVLDGAAARDAAVAVVAAAAFLVLVVPPPAAELAVDEVVVFRVAAARVDRAFSTMLLRRLLWDGFFMGDAGRAIKDFAGDAGRGGCCSVVDDPGGTRLRGTMRVFDDVGESTWDGL